jgi:hypothetical protein
MDVLETELAGLNGDATLLKSVKDADEVLEQLCKARDLIAAG